MTEHKISEQEMQEIWEEADKLYPPPQNEGAGFERYFQTMTRIRQYQRDTHIAALTSERERVKPVIEALEFIEMNYGDHDAVRDKIRQTLNNYKNNK